MYAVMVLYNYINIKGKQLSTIDVCYSSILIICSGSMLHGENVHAVTSTAGQVHFYIFI